MGPVTLRVSPSSKARQREPQADPGLAPPALMPPRHLANAVVRKLVHHRAILVVAAQGVARAQGPAHPNEPPRGREVS